MFKKIITFFTSIFGGLLGAWGGAKGTSKGWRRYGIPGILNVLGVGFKKFKSFFIWIWSGIASIGYGIPDSTDEGSTLGKFWYKILKGNHKATDIAVKGTIGFLYALVLGIIGFFQGSFNLVKITAPLAILSHIVFGGIWHPTWKFKIFGKELLLDEFLRYFTLTLAGAIQIIFGGK
jgi:hypothetical protein